MNKIVLSLLVVIALSACSTNRPDLKSPCVGAEGSPCDNRVPVNDWWLRNTQHNKA